MQALQALTRQFKKEFSRLALKWTIFNVQTLPYNLNFCKFFSDQKLFQKNFVWNLVRCRVFLTWDSSGKNLPQKEILDFKQPHWIFYLFGMGHRKARMFPIKSFLNLHREFSISTQRKLLNKTPNSSFCFELLIYETRVFPIK